MKSLAEYIREAQKKKTALGHFNISDSTQFAGILDAAREVATPVIIGLSEGERSFIGARQAVALVASVRAEGHPVFLNADHTYSVAKAREAVDLGFDAVIMDGAKLPFEENVRVTREVVSYARASGREVLIEGELGYIGTSSKLLDAIPEGAAVGEHMLTTSEEARTFVAQTGVDLLAPAVGNIHGIVQGGNPALNHGRIRALAEAAGVPLVLHGGSGTSNEDFLKAIAAGISIIHINTELRVSYRRGIERGLADAKELAPYKFLLPGREEVRRLALARLRLFSGQ